MRACTSISIGGSSSSRSSSSNCQVQQAAGFQRHLATYQTRGALLSAFRRLHPTGIERQRGLPSACSETGAVSGTTGVEAQQEFKLQQHGQLQADVEANPELQPDQQPSDQQPGQESPPAASQAAADPADLAGDSIAAAAGDATSDSSSAEPPWEMQNCYNYTFYWPQITEPDPVQMPPPDACMEPTRTWFGKSRYRSPKFLEFYPTPAKSTYNFMSFLGDIEANRGKFLAAGQQKDQFLTSYFKALSLKNRRMYIAECYQGQPFKFYQELDFPWTMDPELVLQLVPRVVDIVSQEVAKVYDEQMPPGVTPQPVLSMRTIYKVHLNFPSINTMEAKASVARKAIINRCRAELSGQPPLEKLGAELNVQEHWQEAQAVLVQLYESRKQLLAAGQEVPSQAAQLLHQHWKLVESAQSSSSQPAATSPPKPQQDQQQAQQAADFQQQQQQQLSEQQQQLSEQQQLEQLDWQAIIDFPHGSLRLLGSCKAPWMDSDPVWVTEKAYSRVECVGGVWMRQPLTLADVQQCSIHLEDGELRVFEHSEEFMEVTYRAAVRHEDRLAAKRVKRQAKRLLEVLQGLLLNPPQQLPPEQAAAEQEKRQRLKAEAEARQEQRRQYWLQQEQEQEQKALEAAKQKAEAERRKAEAVARLQAAAAQAEAQHNKPPALIRPAVRPLALTKPAVRHVEPPPEPSS